MKVKIEIVEGVFGHRSLYVHDYRVGGEKPWGGGKVVASFWVEAEDVSKALVRAVADDEADRVRSYSAAKLQALPVGTIVDAGVLPYTRVAAARMATGTCSTVRLHVASAKTVASLWRPTVRPLPRSKRASPTYRRATMGTEIKVGSRVRTIVQIFAEDPPVGAVVTVTEIKERLVLTDWPHPNDPTRGYWLAISDVVIEPSESEDA